MKFKIGDKVKCLGKYHKILPYFNPVAGTVGEIVYVDVHDNRKPYLVQWPSGAAVGNGRCWARVDDLEPMTTDSKIVITSDGATTLARLYDGKKVVKCAEAKCSPSDTYDFKIGANLAYDRLMRPTVEPKKPTNKYEAMSNEELREKACDFSECYCNTAGRGRQHDCPLWGHSVGDCIDYVAAHPELRPTLIQYCLDEDAARRTPPTRTSANSRTGTR